MSVSKVNQQKRYVYALPRHPKAGTASPAQTLLALVLRAITTIESARSGSSPTTETLSATWWNSTKFLPVDDWLRVALEGRARNVVADHEAGIAERSDEHVSEAIGEVDFDQPYAVLIRPAIVDVLGETAFCNVWRPAAGGCLLIPTPENRRSKTVA